MPEFSHLHCHTQYSLLDGAASIPGMVGKAKADGMKALAITDHGNMFGVFKFVNEANKAGIKPIIGCEFYVVEDRFKKSFTGGEKDKRYHQLLLAKDEVGYRNIAKLCSLGFIDGLYSKFPRVDLDLIKKYKEGLIATTCCIGAQVPQTIINKGEEAGERVFRDWLELFGDDYFIELQRHHIQNIDGSGLSQEDVNQILLKWSEKYNVPVIATNDSHYVDEDDFNAHDILLCVNTGDKQATPKGHGKGFRFGFPNSEFYFKTQSEMEVLFKDIPHALDNTSMIVDRINTPELKRDVLLPAFNLPKGFESQEQYLEYLTFEGARKRYGEITPAIEERLRFELSVINDSGYPGYFLIVQDFTSVARDLGVSVGPGRGSAAGSAVAYCLGITNIDPIKYDLLFERFLNPERVSLPDIDIDFDDEGRQKVIDYVVDKYGKNQVAQIITYGSMAAKSSLRDVGRVLDVPLSEVDRVAKSFPTNLSATLGKVLADDGIQPKLKKSMNSDDVKRAEEFRKLAEGKDLIGEMITTAKTLEGSVRNTGVHACGVIITPEEITNLIPVTTAKDSDLLLTQFDNSVVEDAGLLKMDFLGLKTLSIIKKAVDLVKEVHKVEIDIEEVSLEDELTFKLFQRGETNGVFQFESPGMQKNLRLLKPDKFDDLIAMNALYRPGPMEYIPNYINRKHGREEIKYDLPEMQEYLEDTYGITVYQEQVMLLSQKLANFTKGEADRLRKAMGKKKIDEMKALYEKFIDGTKANGHDEEVVKKIWKDWEAFASYAFNKSHSTCYAFVAFQTAYLKAHYPSEFMASVLTNNMSDIKKVGFFMEECKNLGVEVLGPDVNESFNYFTVNPEGAVRFSMSAIKGVGEAAVEEIIRERTENGPYHSIFDLCQRVNLRTVNKRSLEALAVAGAFDNIGDDSHRSRYLEKSPDTGMTGVELAVKFGQKTQQTNAAAQTSLFGGSSEVQLVEPSLPKVDPWSLTERLSREKELVGIYISGHPLDTFKYEVKALTNMDIAKLETEINKYEGQEIRLVGIISHKEDRMSKKGNPWGKFSLEDYTGSREFLLFSEDYARFKGHISLGAMVMLKCKPQRSFRNPDELDLKIQDIVFLETAVEKSLSSFTITVPTTVLSDSFMSEMKEVTNQEGDTLALKVKLVDPEEKHRVQMRASGIKVGVHKGWMDFISTYNLPYSIQ
jgi:DNA polymerase-3 subunit alpha